MLLIQFLKLDTSAVEFVFSNLIGQKRPILYNGRSSVNVYCKSNDRFIVMLLFQCVIVSIVTSNNKLTGSLMYL